MFIGNFGGWGFGPFQRPYLAAGIGFPYYGGISAYPFYGGGCGGGGWGYGGYPYY